jgi:hypothetical protein
MPAPQLPASSAPVPTRTTSPSKSSAYFRISPIPSSAQATPRPPCPNNTPNSKPPATPCIVFLRHSPRERESAALGPVSVCSARSRSATTPPEKIFPLSPGRPFRRVSTLLASPLALLSALHAPMMLLPVHSTGSPPSLGTAGRLW